MRSPETLLRVPQSLPVPSLAPLLYCLRPYSIQPPPNGGVRVTTPKLHLSPSRHHQFHPGPLYLHHPIALPHLLRRRPHPVVQPFFSPCTSPGQPLIVFRLVGESVEVFVHCTLLWLGIHLTFAACMHCGCVERNGMGVTISG